MNHFGWMIIKLMMISKPTRNIKLIIVETIRLLGLGADDLAVSVSRASLSS